MAGTFAKIEVSLRRRKWKEAVKMAIGAAVVLGAAAFAVYRWI